MTHSDATTRAGRRRCRPWNAAAAAVLVVVMSLVAQPAWAHGGATSAPQAVTVDLGELQVRAVIGIVGAVPGRLLIDLSVTTPTSAALPIELRAWPVAGERPAVADGTVRLMAGDAGPYPSEVVVDRAGPWEIELRLPGDAGPVSVARIPITVTIPRGDPAEPARSLAYASAGLLAVTATTIGVLFRRRSPRTSNAALWTAAPATIAALAVAVTLSIAPLSPPQAGGRAAGAAGAVGSAGSALANPAHVNVSVAAVDSAPVAGVPAVLEFLLTDGSSGLPVDDVTPHHEALLHVVVMGDTSRDFAHVHPARVSPGRYLLEWVPAGAGEHVVGIELSRGLPDGSGDLGNQLVQRTIDVQAGTTAPAADASAVGGLGTRALAGLEVSIGATGPLAAGTPIGFSATVTEVGQPTGFVPWLGMEGHMLVRNRESGLLAHLHAVGPMSAVPALAGVRRNLDDPLIEQMRGARPNTGSRSIGDTGDTGTTGETGEPPAGDSTLDFSFTFPVAGRYDAWVQFRHGGDVVTVPMTLEVG